MKPINTLLIFILFLSTNCSIAQVTYEPAFQNIGFEFPIEILSPRDGTDRMYVIEQRGRVKVFPRNNDVMPSAVNTFLDITDRVRFRNGQEVGLLGMAFHPDYNTNRYFYTYYTTDSPVTGISVRMVLSRFTVSTEDPNFVDPDSELVIFQFDKNQNNSNHNGGKIAFGPDGYLYISIGDGGGGNDPEGNGQNKNTVFGSILRIDIDLDGSNPVETNPTLPNGNYEIPSDNPLVNADGLDEIFVYGIRNTWKFSFDTVTGRMWGADVGQNAFEEINIIEKGNNYGWSRFEANSVANSGVSINEPTVFPVHFYNRIQGDRSVTGGYVYRGSEITSLNPDISSKYIFGDYVSGRVWALDYNPSTGDANSTLLFNTSGEFVSSFGVDKNGELYFSDYGSNAQLYKIVDGTSTPSATAVDGIGVWNVLDQGIPNGEVRSIVSAANGDVYHAGTFNQAGSIVADNIAVWNESTGWSSVGTGSNGTINTLKIASNGNLYAGGAFTEIGGITAQNIAMWNGTNWSPVGTGIDGAVTAIVLDTNDNIYAGGIFETINGNLARNIAFWNGTTWSALNDATTGDAGTNNEIRSLAIDTDGTLYVGGNFDEAGGNTANRIATWDGANWGTLGTGTSGFVEAIAVTPTNVFVGGNFSIAGGQTVNRIAQWNKNDALWSALGDGVNNIVNALIHDEDNLYAAGAFNAANTDTNNSIVVNNIARWNETNGWEALGTETNVGVDIKINSINFASDSDGINKVFAGGNFSSAGLTNANNTAQWISENVLSIPDSVDQKTYLYPNPTTGIVQIPQQTNWILTDNSGKTIDEGSNATLDISEYASGMYFLKIKGKTALKIIKK